MHTRENTHQDQEEEMSAQKYTKLKILRRALTEIYSKSDLRKNICNDSGKASWTHMPYHSKTTSQVTIGFPQNCL
jgi:hypothetical protein